MLRTAFALTASVLALGVASAGATSVQVIHCPTTYGVPQPAPRLPSRLPVQASQKALSGLDAYANGVLFVLAPARMRCHALVAANGSASIVVSAAGTSHARQPAVTIQFYDTPGTAGSLACPLFPLAASQLAGARCPVTKPARETTSSGGQQTVYFTDPPHVHGDGNPSGGSYAAHGAMTFDPASSGFNGFVFAVTCTLPAGDRARCATIIADALTRIPAKV
jgi:hypothetical protein